MFVLRKRELGAFVCAQALVHADVEQRGAEIGSRLRIAWPLDRRQCDAARLNESHRNGSIRSKLVAGLQGVFPRIAERTTIRFVTLSDRRWALIYHLLPW